MDSDNCIYCGGLQAEHSEFRREFCEKRERTRQEQEKQVRAAREVLEQAFDAYGTKPVKLPWHGKIDLKRDLHTNRLIRQIRNDNYNQSTDSKASQGQAE